MMHLAKKIIRFAWQIQPRPLRRAELDFIEKYLTWSLPAKRERIKGDAVICGLLGTASGLGQGARHMLQFFQENGMAAVGSNASRLAILEDFDAGPVWAPQTQEGGIIVFHINPDILSLVWNGLGRRRMMKRRIVGMWAWELEAPPERWQRAVKLVDEIWAPSHFVASAMRKIAGDKPIHFVPYIFDVGAVRMQAVNDPLPALKGKTVVFFTYDVRSCHARKNPEGVIEAFRLAAADNPNAALVIKMNNEVAWPEARIRVERAAQGLSNVTVINNKLSDDAMQDLIARVDIVISLHRSEGFGMLMATAMAAAKPVIATGWSANLDFMSPECSVLVDYKLVPIKDDQHIYDKYGAQWADADIGHAAKALKHLLDNPDERRRMGQAARSHVEAFFSKEAWLKRLPQSFWDAVQ
jgi:glycosyltransferase involved in cell wall biosynthesis